MVHLLKERPQIVHINMFFHNCICIKLFMPPEGATQKSYKALQIMSLFRLKTVVKTPMIPYLVCRPKVIIFFFFPSFPPQLKVLLWKSLVGNAWESLGDSALAVLTFWLLFSTFTSVMWWLVLNVSCQSSTMKAECILAIGNQKKRQMPSAEKMLNPCHGTDVFRICKKCAAPISNCKNAFQLRGKSLWCISGVIKLSIRENCIE